jgi:chitinase
MDHILFDFRLPEHDRDRLKAAVLWSENWPVSKNKLGTKFYKSFKEFTINILFDKL